MDQALIGGNRRTGLHTKRRGRRWGRYIRNERGLETVEYAIMLGLIVAATIVAVIAIGEWSSGQYLKAANAMIADPGGGPPASFPGQGTGPGNWHPGGGPGGGAGTGP